jgi:hypothetical protein
MTDSSTGKGGATSAHVGFGTPFQEQIDYLLQKLRVPTERWDDIQRSAHDRAFMVAGAAKADLLKDLHDAVVQRATDGKGLQAFRKDFKAIVAKNGWTGWTGEGSKEGVAWRTKVIYQTNMAQSYAAGRYRQMKDPEYVRLRPYWRYLHREGVRHPRPQHLAWHGLTLPHDHPFWDSHYPPNGWGCGCRVAPVSKAEGDRSRNAGLGEPPDGWDAIDSNTGAPAGIDKGFDYAAGAGTRKSMQSFIDSKLINLDAPIGSAMWETIKPLVAMERQQEWWTTLDKWLADPLPRGRSEVVGAFDPQILKWLESHKHPIPKSAAIRLEDRLVVGRKQKRHAEAQNGLDVMEWRQIPSVLEAPPAVYMDEATGNLIYVADGIGPTKIAVRFAKDGMVATAFRVSAEEIALSVKGGKWTVVRVSGTPGRS